MTGGERWAAEELDALRAGRFGPRPWIRFLGASFRRAADTRRARPQLARQARTWSTIGLLSAVAASTAASRARLAAPRPGRFAAWWLATTTMLEWHLGMVEGPRGEHRGRLGAADAMTLQRLWSVPLVAAQGDPTRGSGPVFTLLIGCAAATDALDGALARRAGPTRLGRDLDKAADAIVVGVAARTAARAGWLPSNAARLALIRSALPVGYAAVIYFRTGQRPLRDSLGPGRQLAPALLGGLAVAPFSPGTGAVLAGAASIAALALAVVRPTTGYRDGSSSRDPLRAGFASTIPSQVKGHIKPAREGRCHFQPSRSAAFRGPAS